MTYEPQVIDLTTELLVQIRDGVHELRSELTATNARIDKTNALADKWRVEFLAAIGRIDARLETLEAGQATLESGQATLEAGQAKLEAGQAKLEAGQRGTNERLGQLVEVVGVIADRTARNEARLAELAPSAPSDDG